MQNTDRHLTQLTELERRIDELTAALADTQKQMLISEKMAMLGELTAGIAHEINTPLGALRSNYDLFLRYIAKLRLMLLGEEMPETVRNNEKIFSMFDNIDQLNDVNKTATERMTDIVNGIRTYARPDDPDPVAIALPELMESTLSLMQHELRNRITVHCDFQKVPQISGYPNHLSQVFLNLLVNACQAIEGQGEIFIEIAEQDPAVVVTIRDTGPGIAGENPEQVFNTGYTTKPSGLGIGLVIVKQIVEKHRGTISLDSQAGGGTTFRISLPVN